MIAPEFRLVGELPAEPGDALDDVWERTREALTATAQLLCAPEPGVTCDDATPAAGCVPAWAVPESVLSVTWTGPSAELVFQVATPGGPVTAELSVDAEGPVLGWDVRNYIGEVAVTRIARWLEHAGGDVTGLVHPPGSADIHVRGVEPPRSAPVAPDPALAWDALMVTTVDAADGTSLVSVLASDWQDDSAGAASACLREAGTWTCTPRRALRGAGLGMAVPMRLLGQNDFGAWITEWRWDERGTYADVVYASEVVLVALGRHRGLVAHRIARVGVGARWRELGVRGDQVEHHERAHLMATLRGDACIRLEWGVRERTVHLLQPGGPPAPGYRREAIRELDAAASIGAAPGVFLIPQTEGAGWVTCPAGYR
ncbi:MAG: hypothetical protein H6726_30655 [Sandaracinaceae bacterium]|nr:hypothetical protein [Sandaracinaceae bacterium]